MAEPNQRSRHDMLFRLYERAFVMCLFLYAMQVSVGITSPYESEIDASAISATIHTSSTWLEIILYACGALLVVLRWKRVCRAARAAFPLLILAAMVPLSTLWSDQPLLTLRRSALFVMSAMFSLYLGERYSLDKLARLLALTFCVMMLAIATFYVVAPEYVIDQVSHPGDWKGLSAYKNAFGQYMAIGVMVLALVRFRRWDRARYLLLAYAVLLLIYSHSAASLFSIVLMMVVVIPLWYLARAARVQRSTMTAIALAVLAGEMCAVHHFAYRIVPLLGRNLLLTGRTQLWSAIQTAIMHRPYLGYGFDVFWASLYGETLQVRMSAGWLAVTADNGFYDLALSLGLVGLAIFAMVFLWAFRLAVKYCMARRSALSLFPVTYFSFFLVHNMSESTLLTRGTLPFLLFVSISTALALEQRRQASLANPLARHLLPYTALARSY